MLKMSVLFKKITKESQEEPMVNERNGVDTLIWTSATLAGITP